MSPCMHGICIGDNALETHNEFMNGSPAINDSGPRLMMGCDERFLHGMIEERGMDAWNDGL